MKSITLVVFNDRGKSVGQLNTLNYGDWLEVGHQVNKLMAVSEQNEDVFSPLIKQAEVDCTATVNQQTYNRYVAYDKRLKEDVPERFFSNDGGRLVKFEEAHVITEGTRQHYIDCLACETICDEEHMSFMRVGLTSLEIVD